MISNREASKRLQKYLNKQDPKLVSRLCANMIIDLNRWLNIKDSSPEEVQHLVNRTKLNMQATYDFVSKDPEKEEDLKLYNWELSDVNEEQQ